MNKLREGTISPEELEDSTKELVDAAKSALNLPDEESAKDYVSGFIGEDNDEIASRGIGAGMNPKVEADKYEEYRALMQQLAAEEGGEEMPVKEEDGMGQEPQENNDPVKLKADVAKLMARLDMSGIAPYLDRIDNPVEQAEVIGQFAEKIGVPRARLGAVIAQLKHVAENTNPKMTKDKLVETVTGRKVIKTIKVKDIK